MVRNCNNNRFAFTMLELIFAIVIISITILSLPMMSQINEKGIESNIVQEAIFAASTELMGASAGYWDTNSMEDSNYSHISRVIDINGDCNNSSSSGRYRLKSGHIAQPFHRRCVISTTGNCLDLESSTFPNLNNAQHSSRKVFLNDNPSSSGYKKTYFSKVDVTRVDNIKYISVTVSDSENTLVVLKMQSANIGEVDYFKRRF